MLIYITELTTCLCTAAETAILQTDIQLNILVTIYTLCTNLILQGTLGLACSNTEVLYLLLRQNVNIPFNLNSEIPLKAPKNFICYFMVLFSNHLFVTMLWNRCRKSHNNK